MTPISHSRPWITEADLRAVTDLLAREHLATGETRAIFESAIAAWVGAKAPGVAVGSGRAALHLSLLALGIGAGDEVVLPTYVSDSLLHAIRATGATPVPCDVGPGWVVTPESMAPRVNARTRALVVPHLYGIFARPAAFKIFGVPVVEHFAEALDGEGRRSLQGDVGVFSFHPTTCLTTGEGGMAVAARAEVTDRLRVLRDGDGELSPQVFSPLPDIAAALGLSQLRRYHEALVARRRLALRYRACLEPNVPEVLARQPLDGTMYFRFPISLAGGLDGCRDRFARQGIIVRRGVNRLLHRELRLSDGQFPNAVALFDTTVSLPLYPALSDSDFRRCADAALEVCLEAQPASQRQFPGRSCQRGPTEQPTLVPTSDL